MRVDREKCIGCGKCFAYCPIGRVFSFTSDGRKIYTVTNEDECVECGVCLRAKVCPTEALYMPELSWPRNLRNAFSDPLFIHQVTRIPGRGTEEMKTNEVTGRYRRGFFGLGVELGRPGTGARFRDVQEVAMAVAPYAIEFEAKNPVTSLMVDKVHGVLDPQILDEKVLSAIVEFTAPIVRLGDVVQVIHEVARRVKTVFSIDLICRAEPDGSLPTTETLDQLGIAYSINGKNNVGLGRPLARED